MNAISWLVGNMHVWTRDREVIREFRRRIKAGPGASRTDRHKIYREALRVHHEHQSLVREFRL